MVLLVGSRRLKEYLAGLDADAQPNPDRKPPKVISPSDPCSAWTAKANKRVQFGYGSAEMLGWLVHERGIEPHVTVFDKRCHRPAMIRGALYVGRISRPTARVIAFCALKIATKGSTRS